MTMTMRSLRFLSMLSMTAMVLVAGGQAVAMEELGDRALSVVTGQALLVADKLDGVAGSNHTFYRMMLDAKLEMNMNIDRLQLGCGGFNEAVVANACDIDFDYVSLMGRGAGQAGATGAGTPADSMFSLTRPYLELAIKNDNDPTRREIVGFKIGSAQSDGYFSIGRYINPNDSTTDACTTSTSGAGAYGCHQGINRLSGYVGAQMAGNAYGCFGLFGCTPNSNINAQDRVASFSSFVQLWGTRMNRIQTELSANSNPDVTIGLSLTVNAEVNESLRFMHGFAIDPAASQYLADDFFISFQREPVRYPTYNKTSTHSNTANPGWWMNVPYAELNGLTAYNVATSAANLFVPVGMTDIDIGQRPPDNCYGATKFC